MRRILTGLFALSLMAALPAISGETGKCPYSTQECLNQMAAKFKKSGWIGVELEMDKEGKAAVIRAVIPGSPAEEAGLREGDLFKALNGVPYNEENREALGTEWDKQVPGKEITVSIVREGESREIKVKLGSMPADLLARYIGQHMIEHAQIEAATK